MYRTFFVIIDPWKNRLQVGESKRREKEMHKK